MPYTQSQKAKHILKPLKLYCYDIVLINQIQHFLIQQSMSFLLQKNLSPHLLLHVLAKSNHNQSQQTLLQKLNLLARTRKFDDILKISQSIQNMQFPSLANNLQLAKKQSQERKQTLGAGKVFEKLKELDDMSKEQDPNFELIDQEHIKIFQLTKILFEEGNYSESLQILVQFQKQELKEDLWLRSTWARLYCEILLEREEAIRTLQALKRKIDDIERQELAFYAKQRKDTSALMKRLYAQKEQYLLLALFVIFRRGNDEELEKWVDYCTTDKGYFSILQLTCPQLLRYVIAALIMNKTLQNNKDNRSFDFFKLVEVLNRKIVKHTDALTEFISLLEIEYDFQAAAKKIEECRTLIKSDVFLKTFENRLIEGLNFLYFKQTCKVYETFPLSEIAAFTGLPAEEAELWILGYIRSGDIDAKIDSISECLVSNKGRQNSSQKYIDVIPALGAFVSGLSRSVSTH